MSSAREPEVSTHEDDDVGIDVGRLFSRMWQRRLTVLGVSVLGGAIGVAYVILTPVRFVGIVQLSVTQAAGAAAATDAVSGYQTVLDDETVLSGAIADSGVSGASPGELRQSLSSRLPNPFTRLFVEVTWPNADAAGKLATSAARRALDAFRQRQLLQINNAQATIERELADAEEKWSAASDAMMAWRKSGALESARAALDQQTLRRRELQQILIEWTDERGRLSMLEGRRDSLQGASGGELEVVRERLLVSEARLAGIAARREYVEGLLKGQTREALISDIADTELRQARLQGELTRAQKVRDRLTDAVAQARRTSIAQAGGLELNTDSAATVRTVGPTIMTGLSRGLATGLVIGIFAVIFFGGLPARQGR